MKRLALAAALLSLGATTAVSAAPLTSVSRIAFGPDNVLFAADWKAGSVHAIGLSAPSSTDSKPFNVLDLTATLRKELKTDQVAIEDMAARPGTDEVYVALNYGADKKPAIFMVTPDGAAKRIDSAGAKDQVVSLTETPGDSAKFWGKIPERSLTVTDMKWHDGKLYVAGLVNQDFASALRVFPYPFTGKPTITTVGIYHTSHNEVETRAPIRAMTFADLGGKPYLIATYTCTPLVTIPLSELKDGAHVTGKTVAELGYGNTPLSVLSFESQGQDGKSQPYVLVANVERNAETIPLSSIVEANEKPGMSQPVDWGKIVGVDAAPAPISGIVAIDNYDDKNFVVLRREPSTGNAQVVSMSKAFKLRLSDFISEYDFPDYKYTAEYQRKYIKPVQDDMMRQEGYANLIPQ